MINAFKLFGGFFLVIYVIVLFGFFVFGGKHRKSETLKTIIALPFGILLELFGFEQGNQKLKAWCSNPNELKIRNKISNKQ